jgi:putative ABC transport system ATP-binding protein
MSNNLVVMQDISRTYQKGTEKVEVLHKLDLTIAEGDFMALMGPSGSGKTTLLNLLGGLDKPTSGSVVVGGAELHKMSSSALSRWRATNIGFIFQFYNLLPVLTAQKNVELPLLLTNLNSKERTKRAATALSIVGLEDRAKHYPRELSGGQEQRVAIARAIVSDPNLLLCDEPTGDLDRETADEILKLLQALNREHNKTIVMVTHDAQAAEYARHTLHVDKGTLAAADAA